MEGAFASVLFVFTLDVACIDISLALYGKKFSGVWHKSVFPALKVKTKLLAV